MLLSEPERHEPASGGEWDEAAARATIERIAAHCHDAFTPEGLWPIHPIDVSPERPPVLKSLYYGAAGVIWALEHLVETDAIERRTDYRPVVRELAERHADDLRKYETVNAYLSDARASYFMGDAGMRMLQWKLEPSDELATTIHACLEARLGDSRGLLWGAAGAMNAALLMHARIGEDRWVSVFCNHFESLWSRMVHSDELGCWLWFDELYGLTEARLAGTHGFAANARAILRGRHLLAPDIRDEATVRIAQTLERTAVTDGARTNWPHNVGPSNRPKPMPWLVQFCSGAPGVIVCMAELPNDGPRAPIEALLRQAGDLIWEAGPTTKLPSLCHGAAGSGYAFLKLHQRTGDTLWLDRARAFAMHAIGQAERARERYGQRKFSLWTGDLGLAVFLWDCIRGDAGFPTLDVF